MADPAANDSEWFDVGTEHLSARLRFNPDDAHIWLESERMLLLHLGAFARLRQDLIERLGSEHARVILTRLGAASGTLDAEVARRAMPHAGALESFKAGPRLHAIEGMVVPEEVRLEVDPDTGFHVGEWIWRHSAEAEAHLRAFGTSAEPVCWTMIGYATAYSSAFMGNPVEYREIECRAMGAPHCRIIGRPAALWEDDGNAGSQLADLPDKAWVLSTPLTQSVFPDTPASARAASNQLTGASPEFGSVLLAARRFAVTDAPVLLLGEEGVGKRSLARSIHALSRRSARRMLSITCSSLDDETQEIELFGHDRTSTEPARQGILERAGGGTVIIEDVQALSPRCQAKLLELLRSGEICRRGEYRTRPIDVRLIACAPQSLLDAARGGQFREDLFYRLSVCPIVIPPLRERRGDLPVLIRHFLEKYSERHRKRLRGISMDGVSHLLAHELPGNAAELEAIIERAVILAPDDGAIGLAHLLSAADLHQQSLYRLSPAGLLVGPSGAEQEVTQSSGLVERLLRGNFDMTTFESELIRTAVRQSNGNLAKAAKLLGLSRPQLAYRYGKLADD